MSEKFLTVNEVANCLKVRCETIRRYIKSGHIKAVSLPGGDYRIRENELNKLLNSAVENQGAPNGK